MNETLGENKDSLFSRIMDGVITSFFFIIVMLTIILVILRYVFNSTIIGGNELMEYLFIYTTALGAALAIGRDEHIRIMYFTDKLKGGFHAAAQVIVYLLIAFINIIIVKLSFPWMAKVGMSESPVMRIPMWTVQVSVPLGCFLVVIYCIINSWKVLQPFFSGKRGQS